MTRLCGAPNILQTLQADEISNNYSIIAFGVWNKEDDNIWQCVLCDQETVKPGKYERMTPYTIVGLKEEEGKREDEDAVASNKERKCRYNKNSPCAFKSSFKTVNLAEKDASTNRIIRVFEGYGTGQPKLLYRFDWAMQILRNDMDIKKMKENCPNDVEVIVIQDHGYGVINNKTIETLISIYKDRGDEIKWYIHSKIDEPQWLAIFKDNAVTIRLNVLHYELAEYKQGPRRWRCEKELGRASLELLGDMTGAYWYEDKKKKESKGPASQRAALLLDDNTVIAKETIKEVNDERCLHLYESPGPKQLINIGRTTIFFASLIQQDIANKFAAYGFADQCTRSLHNAFDWSAAASKGWKEDRPDFYPEIKEIIDFVKPDLASNKCSSSNSKKYNVAWTRWNESSQDCGIIHDEKQNKLQLWRGESAIKGFICPGGPKRNRINELLKGISQFKNKRDPIHPFNCLLISRPGWGKSHLAQSLADHFDMSHMSFSLSQMASTQDLVDCFDSICSHQNRTTKKLLIFMDEVNCQIEGHLAMGLLLGPIWDGSFLRNGKLYKLSPATWIFASTASIDELKGSNVEKEKDSNKGSDFISRINGPIIRLDSLDRKAGDANKFKSYADHVVSNPELSKNKKLKIHEKMVRLIPQHIKTEQVYLGVSLMNRFWGPISYIRENVLWLFHDLVPINGVRSLEFFVSNFQNIQRGVVDQSNVPDLQNTFALQRHILFPRWWEDNVTESYYTTNKDVLIETLVSS